MADMWEAEMEAAAYAHFMRDLAEAQEGGSAVGTWAEAEAEAARRRRRRRRRRWRRRQQDIKSAAGRGALAARTCSPLCSARYPPAHSLGPLSR